MAGSFQDQLLKTGLVNKQKANDVKTAKKKKQKQQRQQKSVDVDPEKIAFDKKRIEQVERDKQLNKQRQEQAEIKAVKAQIVQLIGQFKQSREGGELAYNFADNKKVKKIYVTEKLSQELVSGLLAIVKLDEQYELVPTLVANKISQRDGRYVILCNDKADEIDADDPYADFKVPDDLMW